MTNRILVTGAGGFVGSAVCAALGRRGQHVVRAVRRREEESDAAPAGQETIVTDVAPDNDWGGPLREVDCVIHLAARVHVMQDSSADPLRAFRRTNTAGTLNLARQAAAAGVRRFVYVSSIKVNGERTDTVPFRETDTPAPQDAYATSKHEAETGLAALSGTSGLETVIIRPPLVYGPGVRANFLRLMQAVECGLPLPLASVDNRRSMVSLDNLVDFILLCTGHPHAANQTFLVSDGQDISTPQLIGMLARAMERPARLIPFPPGVVRRMGRWFGKEALVERLLGSLQVDPSKARELLGWAPPTTLHSALQTTANWYARGRDDSAV